MFSDLIADYNFALPQELIAQEPSVARTDAKLLVVRREPMRGLPRFEHLQVKDLPALVEQEDSLQSSLWIRNRSHVLPARFYARRPTGGRHEFVLLEEIEPGLWRSMVRGQADFKYPQKLKADAPSPLDFDFVSPEPGVVDLRALPMSTRAWLEQVGEMPLPPYIKKRDARRDRDRYQPVWAEPSQSRSVAAPTASLHFTPELCASLEQRGVEFADLFLHVGLGTFEPMRVPKLSEHTLHSEKLFVPASTMTRLNHGKQSFLAVGTTALRALESLGLRGEAPASEARLKSFENGDIEGETRLFVRPGFQFRYTRALWTNFHLPESTLYVLVSVFAGSATLAREAYETAVARSYRFFSYGDASIWI